MDSEDWIKRFAHETTEKVMSDLQAEAVALCQRGGGPFAYLFSLERKADLKKFCKQAKITKEEFSHTIFACEMGLLPWRHKISHRNFVPDHLQPTEDEWNSVGPALTSDDRSVPKALRKIMIQFDERRLLVGTFSTTTIFRGGICCISIRGIPVRTEIIGRQVLICT
jgi:hypothetical protein